MPRQPTDWPGRYHFEESKNADDGLCRVVDITRMGIGVQLFGARPRDPIGKRLVVNIEGPAGGSIRIEMVGEVRHIVPLPHNGARVGVEFPGLSDAERTFLDSLQQMQIGW